MAVIWEGLYFSNTGYAEATRQYAFALDDLGTAICARAVDSCAAGRRLGAQTLARVQGLLARSAEEGSLHVQHLRPPAFAPERRARACVGYTVFETDRLPLDWIAPCNHMDEIWVPSRFCVDSFSRAGVRASKLRVIPHGVDVDRFGPHARPVHIEGAAGFVFLSAFYWSKRKGWDVLVRAYLSEFRAAEEVCLVLRASALDYGELRALVEEEFGGRQHAPILLIPFALPDDLMPGLYAAADAFVVPARGEGWGLPYTEAMATGLPTIATNWGGHLDFMLPAHSYLVEVERMVPIDAWMEQVTGAEPDHLWAEPSVDHLRQVMRQVFERRDEAHAKGVAARDHVRRHLTWRQAALRILERAEALGDLRRRTGGDESSPQIGSRA
jgi:glycosyltransferase involved in cell wall biosynthesis